VRSTATCLIGLAVLAVGACLWGAEAAEVAVSKYVPLADLRGQLEYFLGELQRDLASETDYDADHQGRVEKGANTVVVLAQALANHDQAPSERSQAAALMKAAQQVAAAAGDYAEAKAAADGLQAARNAPAAGDNSTPGPPAGWSVEADLVQLMKQVPVINNSLRSGVTSRRFERTAERTAGWAASLAAIAQASSVDFAYCGGEEDQQEWQKICVEMRDACAAVNEAIRSRDQAAATQGLDRIVATCDACHHRFRD
jgi:hypothetical protein